MPTLIRALLIWLLLMAAETVQGAARHWLFAAGSDLLIRQISVFSGALIMFLIAWACEPALRIRSTGAALAVGALWVALTLLFEIGLGYELGLSWTRIASDYDLVHGGLMPIGLLIMALTPWLVRRLRSGT